MASLRHLRFLHTCGGVSFAAFFPNYFEHSNDFRRIRSLLHPSNHFLSAATFLRISARNLDAQWTMTWDLRFCWCNCGCNIIYNIYSYSWDCVCILKLDFVYNGCSILIRWNGRNDSILENTRFIMLFLSVDKNVLLSFCFLSLSIIPIF